MKKLSLTTAIFVFLLCLSDGIQAQATQKKLNQLEMMKQFIGNWKAEAGKDTATFWTCRPYGKTFIIETYDVVKGKKIQLYVNNMGYDTQDDKIKGFILWPNGHYETYIAKFNTEKKLSGDMVDNFNPGVIWGKIEWENVSASEWIWRYFTRDGVKTLELKFVSTK